MKIEKINDHQIRCTLTSDDLAERQLKISELAYGTEKAKELFHDMMEYAQEQFGFEAENIPLMIEAMPITPDSIVLLITKVEDPDELDTRFSKFTQEKRTNGVMPTDLPDIAGVDDILDLFQKLCESKLKKMTAKDSSRKSSKDTGKDTELTGETPEAAAQKKEMQAKAAAELNLIRLFTFPNLDAVISAAQGLNHCYAGSNTLYKDNRRNYQLAVHQTDSSPELFNKVCNILSEYGKGKAFTPAGEAHLREHAQVLVADDALQQLGNL